MSSPVVLNFNGVELKEADGMRSSTINTMLLIIYFFLTVNTLTVPPFWLSDQILDFQFKFMEKSMFQDFEDEFLFVPPPITLCIRLSGDANDFLNPLNAKNKNILLFAVNDNNGERAGGLHWSLLVYSRNENVFLSFDSLNNFNAAATFQLIDVLKVALQCPYADVIKAETLRQPNSFDCGIFLLANAQNVCQHFLSHGRVRDTPVLTPEVATRKRAQILAEIKKLQEHLTEIVSMTSTVRTLDEILAAFQQNEAKSTKLPKRPCSALMKFVVAKRAEICQMLQAKSPSEKILFV